jgi:hypothetical protein
MGHNANHLPEIQHDSPEIAQIVWYRRQINKLQATIWVLAGCWMASCGFFALVVVWKIGLSRNS